ncbi:protein of unknown function [Streptantibioticus cattleyicolor NRRL 8057 = DSM 46488]|nr:protein of unknown function [Streptantibioticus cattleyicolor NRRL 8057 = DSM 46488]
MPAVLPVPRRPGAVAAPPHPADRRLHSTDKWSHPADKWLHPLRQAKEAVDGVRGVCGACRAHHDGVSGR